MPTFIKCSKGRCGLGHKIEREGFLDVIDPDNSLPLGLMGALIVVENIELTEEEETKRGIFWRDSYARNLLGLNLDEYEALEDGWFYGSALASSDDYTGSTTPAAYKEFFSLGNSLAKKFADLKGDHNGTTGTLLVPG